MNNQNSEPSPVTPEESKTAKAVQLIQNKWIEGIPTTTRSYLNREPDPFRRYLVMLATLFAGGFFLISWGGWKSQVVFAVVFLSILGVSAWFRHQDEK